MKLSFGFLLAAAQMAFAQFHKVPVPYPRMKEQVWIDSVYQNMTFNERVGQLFMVAAYSNKDSVHINSIDKLVKDYHVGGLIFFQGGPYRQAQLTNRYQALSKTPLFIGIDAEWGLAMRLDSVPKFPWNMTLGAVQDLKLIERVGAAYGKQSKRLGVHFNFAPVLDINTNPKNPIIGTRSFGEDKYNVTDRAMALMKGIQKQGVFATGKHFPGHGDTDADSHLTLPTVSFTKDRIEEVELYPYRKLFREGLASVMVAHLSVPSFEPRKNYPSSLSYAIVTRLLQKELGFDGLIFTDALNMKGASNFKSPGDIDLEAFLAGNDILLFAENVPLALEKISKAYQDSMISEERLAFSVKKILAYKYRAGLDRYTPINLEHLPADLNAGADQALQYELYENAITTIRNADEIIPIQHLDQQRIAYVKIGDDNHKPFLNALQKYTEVVEVEAKQIDNLLVKLKSFTTVIIGYHKADGAWKKHDFKTDDLTIIDSISKHHKVILDIFAKPYALQAIADFNNIEGIIVSYQNSEIAQIVSAQAIFGSIGTKGKLPVSVGQDFALNYGIKTKAIGRLGFNHPANVGLNEKVLNQIDGIANKAISRKITPGLQVLVARKGKVVYHKSFGTHTYDSDAVKVSQNNLYDVASLTKIAATLPLVMKYYDAGRLSLYSTLGEMLLDFEHSNKRNITLRELLSHHARLQPWEPFYKKTLDNAEKPDSKYYRLLPEKGFYIQVAKDLFLRNDYKDSIIQFIAESRLLPKREYKYSDFAFIILKEYLEKTSGTTLDSLVSKQFYQSIGMNSTLFNPLSKFDLNTIAPTEEDNYFRHQTVQGYVHDMAAAMQGGVAGHAGLFSTALDLAKLMQLYLQKGYYGGERYFSEKTFDVFNHCYFKKEGNRRALGFDKPQPRGKAGATCGCVSEESFGHTGFTGTMAWADPKTELVYIFLSNRTYPHAEPNNLAKENIREDIQQVIQQAIIK